MFPRKEAALGHVGEGYDPIKKAQPLLESLRELEKHEDAVVTRDKLDGREAVKYHIEEGKRTTRLWVDVKTKLPLRYELRIVDHTPNIPLNQWVYSNFEWDPELEGFKSLDDLFDTTPPEGYKVLDRTQENAR
jgi:outer membrane lipoprotein-sorting protein